MQFSSPVRLALLTSLLAAGCGGGAKLPYHVTISGSHVSFQPSTTTVVVGSANERVSVSVIADAGYALSTVVGGDCPIGSWGGQLYQTGYITADCHLEFAAGATSIVVQGLGDGNETIVPSAPQLLQPGQTATFDISAIAPAILQTQEVAGDCPSGTWSGSTYTTGPVFASCGVFFVAAQFFEVGTGGDGDETITPQAQSVRQGGTALFQVDPLYPYAMNPVTGTCPPGTWSGDVYETGPITAPCTLSFSLDKPQFNVTITTDGNMWPPPDSPQTVSGGQPLRLYPSASAGYAISPTVGGSCPTGGFGNFGGVGYYQTGPIVADCTVAFSTTPIAAFTVTPMGDGNETFVPSTPTVVNAGDYLSFSLDAMPGYTLSAAPGGSCPGSSTNNGGYSVGPVTADCTVIFTATPGSP